MEIFVTMGDAKYLDLIAKYLSGNINEVERSDLLSWAAASEANKLFFDEMIQLWSISADYEEEFETDVDAAWIKLDQKLSVQEKPAPNLENKEAKVVPLRPGRWLLRAAAVLLLLAAGYWWWNGPGLFQDPMIVVETISADRQEHQLPDGSIVWLNENTRLSYDRRFKTRDVQLEGEAFFDVERIEDSPFAILSGDTRTTVLGTSFNVRAYPDEEQVEVTVETGKVRLEEKVEETTSTEKEVVLEAGKAGLYIKETSELKVVEEKDPNALAWKTRRLVFENESLNEVIKVLERYFGTEIEVSNRKIYNCSWTANLDKDPKLEEVLEIAAFNMDMEIVPTEKGYLIKGEGCN